MENNVDPLNNENKKTPEEDEEIIDLTNKALDFDDGDDIIPLTETVDGQEEAGEEILDLTEVIQSEQGEDEIVELSDAIGTDDEGTDGAKEEILDLTNVTDESLEETIALTEPIDSPVLEPEDTVLDLTDESEVGLGDMEETIALTEPVETTPSESEETVLDLTEEASGLPGEYEDTLVLTETIDEPATQEATPIPTAEPDDDQEILDLIDDIQSTLDETDGKAVSQTTSEETQDKELDALLGDETGEDGLQETILLGDDDPIEAEEDTDSNTDLVERLGIDLTSELDRDVLLEDATGESATGDTEDIDQPAEAKEVPTPSDTGDVPMEKMLENVLEKVLSEKLESILTRVVEDVVTREIKKLKP